MFLIQTAHEQMVEDSCNGFLELQLREMIFGGDEHGEQALDLPQIFLHLELSIR